MSSLFELPPLLSLPVEGETAQYPVRRIFCVGRNYAAHAAEMGYEVDREAPFYFTKSAANAVVTGTQMAYPPGTEDFHHEMELVLAIGAPVHKASPEGAKAAIFSYGCGLDMTRRDLQLKSRAIQRPWDLGKDFESSAVLAPMTKAEAFGEIADQRIWLDVNGERRQDASLQELVWKVDEIVSDLSHFYHLRPGDLIMTGTPAGVSAVRAGDEIIGGVDGLAQVSLKIT